MQKVNMLRSMEVGDPEYFKLKTWVDGFMRIPFGVNKALSINIKDGIENCSSFMEQAKKTLDECVFGLDNAKMQIMQLIGQWITNPDALGTAIAIKGPPGTGKTSLCLKINELLNRVNIRSCFIKKYYTDQLDEQKILENYGKLFKHKKRISSTEQAINEDYKIALFDDGLQDLSLDYDLEFVCFNNISWIFNLPR